MSQIFSRLFFVRVIQSSKAFSIVGVLVASSIGVIVILGLSGMLSDMNTDVAELEKVVNQKILVSQINDLLLENCKNSLSNSLKHKGGTNGLDLLYKGGEGTSNTDPIQFSVLKDGSADPGKTIFDTAGTVANKEKIKKLYGLDGHSSFQLQCEESPPSSTSNFFEPNLLKINTIAKIHWIFASLQAWASPVNPAPSSPTPPRSGCDCSSGPYPCRKDWSLSLFTMSYKNNIPVYKEILNQGLRITYNGSTKSNFTCHFGTLTPMVFSCPAPQGSSENHFCGYLAGEVSPANPSTSIANSFFGYSAGRNNTTGNTNDFFGTQAGEANISASTNSFFGAKVGKVNTSGGSNSFFGFNAGLANTGGSNSFFGFNAGLANTGGSNSFFGYNAGTANTTGTDLLNIANIIYGTTASATDRNSYPTNQGIDIYEELEVCNPNCVTVIKKSNNGSSREYKKNIVPFKENQKALKALLKTPLFTYQYKKEYPNKKRMGVIAEELPQALQLPAKAGEPIQPDWISIYGYLWAGIKALHKQLMDLQDLALKEIRDLKALFQSEIQAVGEELKKELQQAQTENQSLKKRFEQLKKETRLLQLEIREYQKAEKNLQKEVTKRKKKQELFQKELEKLQKHRQQ